MAWFGISLMICCPGVATALPTLRRPLLNFPGIPWSRPSYASHARLSCACTSSHLVLSRMLNPSLLRWLGSGSCSRRVLAFGKILVQNCIASTSGGDGRTGAWAPMVPIAGQPDDSKAIDLGRTEETNSSIVGLNTALGCANPG